MVFKYPAMTLVGYLLSGSSPVVFVVFNVTVRWVCVKVIRIDINLILTAVLAQVDIKISNGVVNFLGFRQHIEVIRAVEVDV